MSCCLSLSCLQSFLILVSISLLIFYKWATSTFDFFAKRNIAFDKPIPLFGNLGEVVFQKGTLFHVVRRLYSKYKKRKYFGRFNLRMPFLTITDLELIKQIGVKDFLHFSNHTPFIDADDEPLFGRSLLMLKDQEWKDMRATLSPAFTGNKLRQMLPLISKCCQNGCDYLKEQSAREGHVEMDIHQLFIKFIIDMIATTAFGVEINSLKEEDNKFYKTAERVIHPSLWTTIRMFLYVICRKLMKLLGLSLIDENLKTYLRSLVIDTIKHRAENGIIRPDMIHLLMQAQQGKISPQEPQDESDHGFAAVEESPFGLRSVNCKWSDEDIAAQCFLFFTAGFATTSLTLGFCAYEIMANPDVQKKLITEIDETRKMLNGRPIAYEDLQKMKYLDMVISEVLRKWPPQPFNDLAGLHYDPEYWPDPDKFDPERFNDENRQKIKPFSYLPFGIGPRNCIGSRFALMVMKLMVYSLLSEFTLEKSSKTQVPLVLVAIGFQHSAKGGFWMKIKPRNI
ncbi:unnamed protein product [Hermetia illucens]|uniref:Cytochrome P450 n=1 Tax=Hermetia illucens TaxID=343691 RepID=A0A7R8UNK4_HERIL|nr:unnamed protein product [Hermetia illucens]